MGIATSRDIEIINDKIVKINKKIEILENSTTLIGESVTNLSDRQYRIDEHINSLGDKILNIQLLQEGRSVYSKKKYHTKSFIK